MFSGKPILNFIIGIFAVIGLIAVLGAAGDISTSNKPNTMRKARLSVSPRR